MNTQPQTIQTFALSHNSVTAAKNLISESGLIIPRGAPGRILEWTRTGQLIIDFGMLTVFCVPSDSELIQTGGQR